MISLISRLRRVSSSTLMREAWHSIVEFVEASALPRTPPRCRRESINVKRPNSKAAQLDAADAESGPSHYA